MILHALLYALLCLAPAAILVPIRRLDRQPSSEITHEQPGGDDEDRDGDTDPMLAAA